MAISVCTGGSKGQVGMCHALVTMGRYVLGWDTEAPRGGGGVRSFLPGGLVLSRTNPTARFYAGAVQLANWGALTRIISSGVLLSKF